MKEIRWKYSRLGWLRPEALLGLFLALAGCSTDSAAPDTAKPNTISGTLYNADGSPAKGLSVQIFPVDYNPRLGLAKSGASADTVTTDQSGNFQSHSLSQGRYNVLAHDGNGNRCYKDSVQVNNDAVTEIKDTVKAPGSLVGTVMLQPGHDTRTVFILVMGTGIFGAPDAQGRFTLTNLAKGKYSVRFLTTLDDYDPLDSSFTVVSGRTDTVGPIALPFTGIPVPSGFMLRYDTLMRIASLSWNRADTALVSGYNVYREQSNLGFIKINLGVVDTFFRDSMTFQDSLYQYKVRAVDKGGNEGLFSAGISLNAVGAFELYDSLNIGLTSFEPLHYDGRSLIITGTPSGIAKIDTSGSLLGHFSITTGGVNSIDAMGRIWVTKNDYPPYSQLQIFNTDGVLVDSITEPSLEYPQFIGARSGKIFTCWRISYGDPSLYQIRIYDDSLRFISLYPSDSAPLRLSIPINQSFSLSLDGQGNLISLSPFFLIGGDSTMVSIYDSLGNLSQRYITSSIWVIRPFLTRASMVLHIGELLSPPFGQYREYHVLDSAFRPIAIFGHRGPDFEVELQFTIDAVGTLFVKNEYDPFLWIYRLRPQMKGRL